MSFTFKDLFCGAGGSIDGLVAAGGELVVGANHWDRAIETVSANHPYADFICADINAYDMRRLPRTQVLWASVICTELSPAGGNRKHHGQLALEEYGHVPSAAYERTRACALDVVRATEIHRYDVVVVENVVEFARDWELYDWWVEGMCKIRPGYRVEVVNVSAAHVGAPDNDPAPQWRDRIFIVFVKDGIPMPDLEPRPVSWCFSCEELVEGVQTWKRRDRRRIGKYGQQYVYRCPRSACDHSVVEPLVLPAAAAIDWSDTGQRIGDRPKPLAPATLRRIRAGLEMFAQPVVATVAGNTYEAGEYRRVWPAEGSPLMARQATGTDALACPPVVVNANHDDARPYPAEGAPFATRTAKIGDGIATAPFVVVNRNHNRPRAAGTEPLAPMTTGTSQALVQPFVTMLRRNGEATGVDDEPLATVAAAGRHHALTVPPGAFVVKNHGGVGYGPIHHMTKGVDEPLPAVVAKPNLSLVVPYRRTNRTRTTAEPLHAVSTVESAGLCSIELAVEECHYRMLKPREHLRAQRFRDSYVVKGNLGEQTMQAGNAVPCNVAQWIGERIAAVLA